MQNVGFFAESERFLSLARVAELWDVSIWTVRKWVQIGKINSIRLGRRRLIPYSEIQRISKQGLL